jgi:hypothetical protein
MPQSPLYLPTIAPSTVEQATAAMIVAGGEGPILGSVVHRPDREAAASLLDEALRECLTEGWTFNTEHGLEISSTATIGWLGTDGTAETLNIFEPPRNLLSFKVTQSREQEGLDFVVRPPRDWLGGPSVFYDRVLNRDGFKDRTSLYIDPTWLMDYEDLPQTARNVVFLRALRRFLTQIVGDLAAADRKERDELLAFRNLKKEFGAEDRYNLFGNLTTARHFGFRFFDQSSVDDRRGNRSGSVGGSQYRVVTSVDVLPGTFTLDSFEPDEVLRVPASISLRRTSLAFRLTNPNSGDVDTVDVTPEIAQLETLQPLPVPGSVSLQVQDINLIAPDTPAMTVTSVEVSPENFEIQSTSNSPVPGSVLLLSNTVSLSTASPSFSMTAALVNNDVINPGQSRNGTVTIIRSGTFSGEVTLSSADSRVTFPNGTTIFAGQTTLAFVFTAPGLAGNSTDSVQVSGTGTGVNQQAANFIATVGIPSLDVSFGAFPSGGPGSALQGTLQIIRTNTTQNVTVTANRPLNPTFQDRQNNLNGSQAWVDVMGTGAIQNSGTIAGTIAGSTVFPNGSNSGTVSFTVPMGMQAGTYSTVLQFSAPGATTIQRTFTVTVVASGGSTPPDPATVVTSITVTPSSFNLNPTTTAPIPQSIALGASSVTLTTS